MVRTPFAVLLSRDMYEQKSKKFADVIFSYCTHSTSSGFHRNAYSGLELELTKLSLPLSVGFDVAWSKPALEVGANDD